MELVLLSLHVIAAILTVGPLTAAVWAFVVLRPSEDAQLGMRLHELARVGAVAALAVPVLGVGTALQLGVLTDAWLLTAIALTVLAAAVLVLGVLPEQRRRLGLSEPGSRRSVGGLRGATVAFTLLWVVVVTLMVFRPGATPVAA